jgi:TonB family protein
MRTLLIALLFAGSTAQAAEWVLMDVSAGENFKLYVDKATIIESYPYKKAWFKLIFGSEQKGPDGIRFNESWQLMYFDCDERKMTLAQAIIRKDGKIITTETNRAYLAQFEEIAPETRGEAMLDITCKGRNTYMEAAEAAKQKIGEAEKPHRAQDGAELIKDVQQAGAPARITRPANPDDYYPQGSMRRQEQGSPVVQACVGPSGYLLREPVVTDTSGFPELDGAAIKVAKATRYAAGTVNGTAPAESCIKFKVKFVPKRN